VIATNNSNIVKLLQGSLKRLIERGSRHFPNESGKVPAVNGQHSFLNVSVHEMPANAEYNLIGDKADGASPGNLGAVGIDLEHSGDRTPGFGIDLIFRGGQATTRMSLLVTGQTDCNPFNHVLTVKHINVLKDFFLVSVKLPNSYDDMIKFYHVMTFEIILRATLNAKKPLVPGNPLGIIQRGPYSVVKAFINLSGVCHCPLYTTEFKCVKCGIQRRKEEFCKILVKDSGCEAYVQLFEIWAFDFGTVII